MISGKQAAFRFVLLLSLVSLCSDTVYEGARSISGPFLSDLGASAVVVGAVAGFGELLGYALRLWSGKATDKTRAYWTITIIGYAVNLLAVPALALANYWQVAALLLLVERAGKAIRTPARDVMLSAAGDQLGSGSAFGLHRALDQIGAICGPLLVALVVFLKHGPRIGFVALGVPAVAALCLLFLARAMYPNPHDLAIETPNVVRSGFPKSFWIYLGAVSLVGAGTVDYPLIAYHFKQVALVKEAWIPVFYSVAMGTDAVAGLFFGRLFDKAGVAILAGVSLLTAFVAPAIFRKYSNLLSNQRVALVIGWDCNTTLQYEGRAVELIKPELEVCRAIHLQKFPDAVKFEQYAGMKYFKVLPKWLRYTDLSCIPWKRFELQFD